MTELAKAEALLTELCELEKSAPALSKVYQKLSRKIHSDISFLRRHVESADEGSINSSSNLPYFSGVLDTVKRTSQVSDIICDWKNYGITVDVVCEANKTWKKVVARNPQSLHLIWAGKGQFGSKDIVRKAKKYVTAAKKYCPISPPKIVYVFCSGVTVDMAEAIQSLGVVVEGDRVLVSDETLHKLNSVYVSDSESSSSSDDDDQMENARIGQLPKKGCTHMSAGSGYNGETKLDERIKAVADMSMDKKIFLDITAMLLCISDVCNGGNFYDFDEKVLAQQAYQEKEKPALKAVQVQMEGRELVSCRSAVDNFSSIVGTLAGAEEKRRSEQLKERLIIVPDCMSEKFERIIESGQIRARSKTIFGSADTLKCQVLTSNAGFVRAVANQGIHISSVIHAPRALSEQKRVKAQCFSISQ